MSALAERNFKLAAQRRRDEAADALHFVVYGHDEHIAEGCLFESEGGEACSRDYDALPYPGRRGLDAQGNRTETTARQFALPVGEGFYAGTGIGALYGLPGSESFMAELAGWNVTLGRRREKTPVEEVLVGLMNGAEDDDAEAVDE